MEQRKKTHALAEIRGLYLPKYAESAWEKLDDRSKELLAERIKRIVLYTDAREANTTVLVCSRCQELKSRIDFHKSVSTKKGTDSWCKACRNEYMREWQANKRGKLKNPAI